jgi:HlyD family secretion protein
MRAIKLVIALGLALLAVSACPQRGGHGGGAMGGGGGFQMPPTPVIVEPVAQVSYAPALELVGDVRATQRATLSAEVGGRVVMIKHRVGEGHSRADGPLVQINTADYEAAVAAAAAGLAQAEEALRMAQNGPRPQDIAAQRAQVEAADAQYKQALDNLERQQELYDAGVIAETMLVAAQTQADAAESALKAQQELLDQLLEGTREEQVNQAKSAVDAAQSRLTQANLALEKTSIAPAFDAIVTALMVEIGSFVAPGQPVVEVVADEPGEAWFNLPDSDISQVDPGDQVELRFDALGDEAIMGTVISVSPSADVQTRQFPVRVAINDGRALPGMVAHGRILLEEPRPTIMVKRDATVLTNLGMAVFTMQPPAEGAQPPMEGMPPLPTANMVLVQLGDTYGDMVEVISDELQPGMMVVTRGNEQLQTGANIMPTNLMGEGGMGSQGGGPPGAGESGPPAGMEGEAHPPAGHEAPPADGATDDQTTTAPDASK